MWVADQDQRFHELLAHAEFARRIARSLTRDHDDAEDLVQEAWVAVLRQPPEGSRNRAWLAGVLRNLALMGWRTDGRRQRRHAESAIDNEAPPSPEETVARARSSRALAGLVLDLPEPYRSTVLLRYFEGLSAADIAVREDIPAGTVRWRLKHALELLRGKLDESNGGDRQAWMRALAPLVGKSVPWVASSAGKVALSLKVSLLAVLTLVAGLKLAQYASHRHEVAALARGKQGTFDLQHPSASAPSTRAPVGIEGAVRYADGRSCAASIVAIERVDQDARGSSAPIAHLVAGDRRGVFSLTGLTPGDYSITATCGEQTAIYPRPITLLAAEMARGVELILDGKGIIVRGSVHDRLGGIIVGAEVRALDAHKVIATRSDASGNYALRVSDEVHAFDAGADGYARAQTLVRPTADAPLDFTLTPASHIVGVAVFKEGGAPVVGARVRIAELKSLGLYDDLEATSDQQGRFHFDNLDPGRYELVARRDQLVGASAAPVSVSLTEQTEVRLELGAGRSVSGRTLDEAGHPIAGAEVRVRAPGPMDRHPIISNERGEYRVEGLLADRYELDGSAEGFVPTVLHGLQLVEHDLANQDLVLARGFELSGVVVDKSGAPVKDAVVSANLGSPTRPDAEDPSTRSASDGSFHLTGLAHGVFTIFATHQAGDFAEELDLERDRRDLRIQLASGVLVRGRVTKEDGTAIADASITGSGIKQPDHTATSLADGSFTIGPFIPGHVSLRLAVDVEDLFSCGGYECAWVPIDGGKVSDVLLVRREATHKLSGVVVDAAGKPAVGVAVGVSPESKAGDSRGTDLIASHAAAYTDMSGRFALTNLRAGQVTLSANAPGSARTQVEHVAVDRSDVRIALARAGVLRGIVREPGGPSQRFTVWLLPLDPDGKFSSRWKEQMHDSFSSSDGSFSFEGVPAGELDVKVRSVTGNVGSIAHVSVSAGATTSVSADLRAGFKVRGRVLDWKTGQPMGDCTVHSGTATGRTDGQGRFALDSVEQDDRGHIDVTISPMRSNYMFDSRQFSVPANGELVIDAFRMVARAGTSPPATVGLAVHNLDGSMRVHAVAPDGSAHAAGIVVGDQVVRIDGYELQDLGHDGAWTLLEGEVDTDVKLDLVHENGEAYSVTLRRRQRPGGRF